MKVSRSKVKESVLGVSWNIVALLLSLIFIFPFIYMLFNSFAPGNEEIFSYPPKFIPSSFRYINYLEAFNQMRFIKSLINTLIILVPVIILNMFGSLLAAYGFARFKAKGKNVLFIILMSTMMLPWVVTMVPAFVVFKYMGWIGTFMPLIVPAFGGSAFNIFMMRQFIMSIP